MTGNTKKLRVLYVEDEPLPRWTGVKMLEALGAFVITAESCAEAEEQWHANVLDLVICDCRLADGMATDVVARMRLAGRAEPVFCLTGEAEDISEEDRNRLKLKAVLRKPMDSDLLEGLLREISAHEAPAAPETPVMVAPSFPVWVSPIWGMQAAPDFNITGFVLAPGNGGDVWIAAFGCADVFEGESSITLRLGDLLGQLCRGLPAQASAQALLLAGIAALKQGLDPEHDWNLEVLHLHEQGASAAANGPATLRAWVASESGAWLPLAATGDVQPARRVLLGAPGMNSPEAAWSALVAGGMECAGCAVKASNAAIAFWAREPLRALFWAATARDGALLTSSLCKVEEALVLDGVPAETARRASCGLLDLVEWGGGGRLKVQWCQAGNVDVLLEGAQPPPREFARFFTEVSTGAEGSSLSVAAAHSRTPAAEQRPSRAWRGPAPERLGRFAVAALPELVNESVAGRMAEECASELWLALDCSRVKHVSSRALAVWGAQAVERRMGGRFCLVNYSSLLGRVFRSLGLHREMELVPAHEELDASGRRLTSLSERALLMESFVGGAGA